MGALCTFLTRKGGNAKWILYHSQCILHYIFLSTHCEMELVALRNVSLKQVRKRATQQMYFI